MPLYAVTFKAAAVSVAQDLFEVVCGSGGIIIVHQMVLAQTSDMGDAQAESLQIVFTVGFTTTGSGGASATPAPIHSSNTRAATATCKTNNTGLAVTGTTRDIWADGWNIQGGYNQLWTPEIRFETRASERLVVRQSAPQDAITLNGTFIYEER